MYTYKFTGTYVHTHIHKTRYTYTYKHTHIYTYKHTHTHTHTHVHICTYTYIYKYKLTQRYVSITANTTRIKKNMKIEAKATVWSYLSSGFIEVDVSSQSITNTNGMCDE